DRSRVDLLAGRGLPPALRREERPRGVQDPGAGADGARDRARQEGRADQPARRIAQRPRNGVWRGARGVYVECVSPRLLALLIAGAALSTGCGQAAVKSSSQAKPKPSQNQGLIAESAAATADAGTARAAYTMKMTGLAGASGGVTATGTGAVDFASRSTELQLHMTVPQAGMTVDMSERMVGTTLYMHSPLLSGATGKPWIKLDLQKLGKSEGLDMNSAMSTGGSDPTQMLSYLNAASDSIDRIGTQVVRGTQTT